METLTNLLKEALNEGWEITNIREENMFLPSHYSFGAKKPLRIISLLKEADDSCSWDPKWVRREIPLDHIDGVTILKKGVAHYWRYSDFIEERIRSFERLFEEADIILVPDDDQEAFYGLHKRAVINFLQYHNWYCGGTSVTTLATWVFDMAQAWIKFKKEFGRADLRGYKPEAQWCDWRGPFVMDHEMFDCGKDRRKMAFKVIFETLPMCGKDEEELFLLNRMDAAYQGLIAGIDGRPRELCSDYMSALVHIVERVAAALEGSGDRFEFGF